ncbi:MAG: NERD domain-containing protein [Clostridia bacterium]|nr:NERD domain-containing protein [Clostridia bacterium]
MEFLRVVLIIIGGAAFVILIAALISTFYHRQRDRARKGKSLSPREELDYFLTDNNYRQNVFISLYFPVLAEGTVKTHHYQRADAVVVTNGGILILTVFDRPGRIDNADDELWVVIKDDDRREIESPLVSAEKCKQAIHAVMKRAGYGKVPIYSTVIFINDESIPLAGDDDIVYMSELEKLLHDLGRQSVLGKIDQFYVSRAIRSAGMTKEKIRKNKL